MIPALFALWAAVSGEWGQGGASCTPHPSRRIWASLGRLWKELWHPAPDSLFEGFAERKNAGVHLGSTFNRPSQKLRRNKTIESHPHIKT